MKIAPLKITRLVAPAIVVASALILSVTPADAASVIFDFTRTSGDRAHNFGTNQTANNLSDANNTATGFYVSGTGGDVYKYSAINSSGWSILNDSQPDIVNATLPDGYDAFNVSSSSPLTLRSRLTSLSSGQAGAASYGGLLFGLTDFSSTASGYIALYRRTPNNSSAIGIYNFTNGNIGSMIASANLASSADAAYFLSLSVESSGNFVFSLYSDTSIAGTGNSTARLTSSDFTTATPYSTVSGTISGYHSGYTGVYFRNDSTTQAGGVNYGNYYMNYTAVPEPGVVSLLGLGGLLALVGRRRRKSSC